MPDRKPTRILATALTAAAMLALCGVAVADTEPSPDAADVGLMVSRGPAIASDPVFVAGASEPAEDGPLSGADVAGEVVVIGNGNGIDAGSGDGGPADPVGGDDGLRLAGSPATTEAADGAGDAGRVSPVAGELASSGAMLECAAANDELKQLLDEIRSAAATIKTAAATVQGTADAGIVLAAEIAKGIDGTKVLVDKAPITAARAKELHQQLDEAKARAGSAKSDYEAAKAKAVSAAATAGKADKLATAGLDALKSCPPNVKLARDKSREAAAANLAAATEGESAEQPIAAGEKKNIEAGEVNVKVLKELLGK